MWAQSAEDAVSVGEIASASALTNRPAAADADSDAESENGGDEGSSEDEGDAGE